MRWGTKLVATLVAALSCGALCAPGAFAAPPNDNFADRQVLAGPLPIEVGGSNVGATKEPGESPPIFAAGRSVWFEWEATETGWVTVGSCASGFPSILGIFTGSAVGALTPVVQGNANEGPGCTFSQSQYTFKAKVGTDYAIAVDGNAFSPPEAPPPVTEGNVVLRIERTLPPPNDIFGSFGVINGRIHEESSGSRFYFASARGYNWAATTEPGEPIFGTGAGASVWYSWTPPESGSYMVSGPCCSPGLGWAMYSGDSLASLTVLPPPTGVAGFPAVAGTPYRIAVYGLGDSSTGEPTAASFTLTISGKLAPGPGAREPERPPAGDTTPPETTLLQVKALRRKPLPPGTKTFAFSSSETPSTFRCRLDDRSFGGCKSPKAYRNLKPGRHKFEVFAVDAVGNKDPTPATARFKVPKPKPPKPKG